MLETLLGQTRKIVPQRGGVHPSLALGIEYILLLIIISLKISTLLSLYSELKRSRSKSGTSENVLISMTVLLDGHLHVGREALQTLQNGPHLGGMVIDQHTSILLY